MSFGDELKLKIDSAGKRIVNYLPGTEGYQRTVIEASRYAVLAGGKRIRPLLIESAYILCGGGISDNVPEGYASGRQLSRESDAVVAPFMAAMEMMHSASLVHDDLPSMDNDALRRGKPSTWAKYGEGMGTLAGDALMIYAFETAAKSKAEPGIRLRAMEIFASKSGIFGMTGGQSVDVELTGRAPDKGELLFIYKHKTAALIEASLMIGGVLAGADDGTVEKLEKAGELIGLAFQIEDDILDISGNEEELGKPVGSDEKLGKVTWATVYGIDRASEDVRKYTEEASEIIKSIGNYPFLDKLILYLTERTY